MTPQRMLTHLHQVAKDGYSTANDLRNAADDYRAHAVLNHEPDIKWYAEKTINAIDALFNANVPDDEIKAQMWGRLSSIIQAGPK